MQGFIMFLVCCFTALLVVVIEIVEETSMRRRLESIFKTGYTVKFYEKTSNVMDTIGLTASYEVLGLKDGYVRFKNLNTGVEVEESLLIDVKFSDRCEVYNLEGKMIALFKDGFLTEFDKDVVKRKSLWKREKKINMNCD